MVTQSIKPYRTKLFQTTFDKNFSFSTRDELVHLLSSIQDDKKMHEAIKQSIVLVENSKTEQEAIEAVKNLVDQMKR